MISQEKFLEYINTHQLIIHKICNIYTKNADDKEDLFQEIILQAWKGASSFQEKSKFSTWLYRVALNTAINYFKKEIRRPLVINDLPLNYSDPDQFNTLEEDVKALYKAIEELSNIDKALIMLYLEDYPYQEIGEILGLTANNVAVKMSRIKELLQKGIKKYAS